jgi:hypothetical protein
MSDTANTIRKKVERAEEHFANLKAALGIGGSPIESPTRASIHVDAQGNLVYRTDLIEPTPEHGIIIGDLVHQLRSCLDHIVYAMVQPRFASRNHTSEIRVAHSGSSVDRQ